MDENGWIREIQKGRTEYFQDIAEKYYDDIYRFCCFCTGDRENAYDLAQETFLRFIRYVENYRYRNLKGYLLTIAMNVCRDYGTGRGRSAGYEKEWKQEDEAYPSAEPGPEEAALAADRLDRLNEALAMLPDMQREAVVLHFYAGMKFREIGRLTGVGASTAKSRVRQAVEKLKGVLRREDFYET